MRIAAAAACVAALSVPVSVAGQGTIEQLQGAWRVTEVAPSAPGAGVLTSPQPGLLLFVDGHYSYTFVTSDEPRAAVPSGLVNATDLLTAWNPFTANAGTFEISGDSMIRRPFVAKSPAAMAPGAFNEYTFRLSADTLWTTSVGTETGPSRSPTTVRYVRLR
jgi:hypothetical protein